MNHEQFSKIIKPLYLHQPPHLGFEQGKRLERLASGLITETPERRVTTDEGGSAPSIDPRVVRSLALLLLLAPQLRSSRGPRATLEAFLVQEGWEPRQSRELFRALENLPDKPQSPEEALVADAYCLLHLGTLGFAIHLANAVHAGEDMQSALAAMKRFLTRKLYTPLGAQRAQKGRATLKTLMQDLAAALEQ